MQLKVEDLRVGNAFIQKGCQFVEFATIQDLVRIHEGVIIAEPIPLTEEWLVRFGFKKDKEDKYHYNFYIASFIADYPMWFGQSGCCQDETIKENIKYVHELQNLYYSLTNQELTCN